MGAASAPGVSWRTPPAPRAAGSAAAETHLSTLPVAATWPGNIAAPVRLPGSREAWTHELWRWGEDDCASGGTAQVPGYAGPSVAPACGWRGTTSRAVTEATAQRVS